MCHSHENRFHTPGGIPSGSVRLQPDCERLQPDRPVRLKADTTAPRDFVISRCYPSEYSPVESPNCSTSVRPILCITVSITFAIGVPDEVLRCMLPAMRPLAQPR